VHEGPRLDTTKLQDLTPEEAEKVAAIRAKLKAEKQPEADVIRLERGTKTVERLVVEGVPEQEARKRVLKHAEAGRLSLDATYYFDDGRKATGWQILENLAAFDGAIGADPLEPSYPNATGITRNKAIWSWSGYSRGVRCFSHAHGGQKFILAYDAEDIVALVRAFEGSPAEQIERLHDLYDSSFLPVDDFAAEATLAEAGIPSWAMLAFVIDARELELGHLTGLLRARDFATLARLRRFCGRFFEMALSELRGEPPFLGRGLEDVDWSGLNSKLSAAEKAAEEQEAAPEEEQEEAAGEEMKLPLFRALPNATPFPVDALGALRKPAETIQALTQAPIELCGQSVLAAATLVTQPHRNVALPGGGTKPLINFFMPLGVSGERKTTVDGFALRAVYAQERRWQQEYAAEINRHEDLTEALKARREILKKTHKNDPTALLDALQKLGPEPAAPRSPMLLLSDFTPQALVLHLERAARSFTGIFTSEGGVVTGSAAFDEEQIVSTGALYNNLWDGGAIRRNRVGTGQTFLQGRRCAAHVMVQPEAAFKFLTSRTLDGLGTLARFLVSYPPSRIGTRLFATDPTQEQQDLVEYDARITELLQTEPCMQSDGALIPSELPLSPDARELWIAFYNEVERSLAEGGERSSIRAFGAKMAEHAGRLAGVIATYTETEVMEIDAATMAGGIALARYFGAEMQRLKNVAAMARELTLAEELLRWWQRRKDPRCTLREIYQFGPNGIRSAKLARHEVDILVAHLWVRRLKGEVIINGVKHRAVWELIP
jgi:hypothetical protein